MSGRNTYHFADADTGEHIDTRTADTLEEARNQLARYHGYMDWREWCDKDPHGRHGRPTSTRIIPRRREED